MPADVEALLREGADPRDGLRAAVPFFGGLLRASTPLIRPRGARPWRLNGLCISHTKSDFVWHFNKCMALSYRRAGLGA